MSPSPHAFHRARLGPGACVSERQLAGASLVWSGSERRTLAGLISRTILVRFQVPLQPRSLPGALGIAPLPEGAWRDDFSENDEVTMSDEKPREKYLSDDPREGIVVTIHNTNDLREGMRERTPGIYRELVEWLRKPFVRRIDVDASGPGGLFFADLVREGINVHPLYKLGLSHDDTTRRLSNARALLDQCQKLLRSVHMTEAAHERTRKDLLFDLEALREKY